MKHLSLFIELTRLKKPIGFMLLFWPCAWGLTLAFNFKKNIDLYFFYLVLFFLGSVLMRSAGCIVNDIFDKDFDQKVLRTKNRPLASGKVSIKLAIIYSCILCLIALLVLLNFNYFTIILALGSMPLAFSYPLMKRFTYWPQLFLGITFNYGLILGWTAIYGQINLIPILMYFGAIFWTLAYDTIYGFQDIKDDEVIGLRSTSIKFKKNPIIFLNISYGIFALSLISIGFLMKLNLYYFIFISLAFIQMFFFQIKKLKINDSKICLNIFKSNNFLGSIIFMSLIMGKI
jgi:4-hydroxybenzoate polyprenyltransferase